MRSFVDRLTIVKLRTERHIATERSPPAPDGACDCENDRGDHPCKLYASVRQLLALLYLCDGDLAVHAAT
jgi:hypothetical protein